MKRISFMILPIAVISLLCGSCADAPESVRSNNQKADTENGQLVYDEGEKYIRTKFTDYDIIRVDVILNAGGTEKELSAEVKR